MISATDLPSLDFLGRSSTNTNPDICKVVGESYKNRDDSISNRASHIDLKRLNIVLSNSGETNEGHGYANTPPVFPE